MEIKEYKTRGCCGKQSIFYKIDQTVNQDLANKFIDLGLKQADHLAKAGIMYCHNNEYIISGMFGSNKLQLKCKISDCTDLLLKVEDLFKGI